MSELGWQVGDGVLFPTNSDTVADDVDGREGVVVKVGTCLERTYLLVSVDGCELTMMPGEVSKID